MAISLSSVVKNDTLASVTTACFKNSEVGLGFSKTKARSISTFSPTTLLTRSSNLSPAFKAVSSLAIATGNTLAMGFCTRGFTLVALSARVIIVVTRSRMTPLFTV